MAFGRRCRGSIASLRSYKGTPKLRVGDHRNILLPKLSGCTFSPFPLDLGSSQAYVLGAVLLGIIGILAACILAQLLAAHYLWKRGTQRQRLPAADVNFRDLKTLLYKAEN